MTGAHVERSGVGSSPRVRGTEDDLQKFGGDVRFIPACAGNSHVVSPYNWQIAVHPRVCGEQHLMGGKRL